MPWKDTVAVVDKGLWSNVVHIGSSKNLSKLVRGADRSIFFIISQTAVARSDNRRSHMTQMKLTRKVSLLIPFLLF